MSFIVSSRKYRPQQFKTIKGQEHIITTLKNALKNKQLAQVFLFCGPKGTGKTTCARVLAKAINCLQLQTTGEPCNTCDSCQRFQKQTSLNIHELDAASNNSVEDIRHLVEQVRYYTPSGKKVFIIDEAHMLSKAAFNALLKTLEEPPEHVVFILATTEKYKIIPTILSRCQVFDFHRITPTQIITQLQYIAEKENIVCEQEALHLISHKAEGSLRDALSMFDLVVTFSDNKKLTKLATLQHLHLLDHNYYFKVASVLATGNVGDALLLYNEIMRLGFSGQDFVTGLSEHLRNLLVCQVANTLPLFNLATTTKQAYKTQAKQISTSFLYNALELTHTCGLHYKNSHNKQLHVELMLVKIAQLIPTNKAIKPYQAPINNTYQKNTTQKPTNETTEKKPYQAPINNTYQKNTTQKPTNETTEKKPYQAPANNTYQKYTTTRPKAFANKRINTFKSTLKVPISMEALKTTIVQKDIKQIPTTTPTTTSKPQPLDQTQVLIHWKDYRENIQKTENKLAYTIMKQAIKVVENTIIITLSSPIQKGILAELKPKLLPYLQKKLNNNTIALKAEIKESKEKRKPFTNEEKLQYLTKKYPPIALLQKELALETL